MSPRTSLSTVPAVPARSPTTQTISRGAIERKPEGTGRDARKYPRAGLNVKVRLSVTDDPSRFFEAALPTNNVSVGGLFLESTFFLKIGTLLDIQLSLPPHDRVVHARGQVVRVETMDSHEQKSGFALRFIEYLDGSEVVLATHFLAPVLREFISEYARAHRMNASLEYVAHTADVLAAWELRKAELGGDVWDFQPPKPTTPSTRR